MTFTITPGYPKAICQPAAKIVTADGTNKVTVYTASADGALIKSLFATSTDTSSRTLVLYITKGGVDYQIAQVSITNLAGAGNIPVNLLNNTQVPYMAYDSDGNKCLMLGANCALKASVTTAVTAAKELAVVGYGSEY